MTSAELRIAIETQHQLLQRVQSSESRYKALVEQAAGALFVFNPDDGHFVEVNQQACKSLGYTSDELLQKCVSDISPQHDLASRRLEWAKFEPGKQYNFIATHQRKDGYVFPVEIHLAALEIGNERLMMAVVSDITERKQTEAELRIAAIAFESQESMMVTDANGTILRVNKAFTEATGFTADDAVGQTPRILQSGRHNSDFYHEMWESIRRTGSWRGEIWDQRKNGEAFPKLLTITAVKDDNGIITHYVGVHIDITQRKAAEEKITILALYDHLTRLPNRRLLLDRLQLALASSERSGRKGALLFIDLDNFKNLNDSLGHNIGDLLLIQVAERLKSCVREDDSVARLGGDEFVVMLLDLSDHPIEAAAQTESIGEKIIIALSQPYQLAAHEYRCTASIGVALFSGSQQTTDDLMKQADIAMYQAKKAGRNSLRFFDQQMQENISARLLLEEELNLALEKQQFNLYYQIQVDSSSRPFGAEVLIRWEHPGRGQVMPAQFIPLAEETGLILPIGQWVMETACAQLKAWEKDALTRDLILSVNVSAKQFHQADFVKQVQATVQRHAINPKLLNLELTEGMLLEDITMIIATMSALKAIGVQISLDDFGTGYSSLQYLKRLPLNQLKIDRSFVRDLVVDNNDKAIVRTIIAMAQNMELDIIAEGVETEAQLQQLVVMGCHHFQGYLFSRPVPIEQFEAQLKQS
jgi:diguanylate cyclase (GGDEF)-like protein/PAS domain S-box-containing protein